MTSTVQEAIISSDNHIAATTLPSNDTKESVSAKTSLSNFNSPPPVPSLLSAVFAGCPMTVDHTIHTGNTQLPTSSSIMIGNLMVARGSSVADVGQISSYFNSNISTTHSVAMTSSSSSGPVAAAEGLIQPSLDLCHSRPDLNMMSSAVQHVSMVGYRRPFSTAKPPYSYISLITMAIQV